MSNYVQGGIIGQRYSGQKVPGSGPQSYSFHYWLNRESHKGRVQLPTD